MSERVTIEVQRVWPHLLRDEATYKGDIVAILADRIEAALPPEEPMGQGAVVRDARGFLYMRDNDFNVSWRDVFGSGNSWEDLGTGVEVLFEGVDE